LQKVSPALSDLTPVFFGSLVSNPVSLLMLLAWRGGIVGIQGMLSGLLFLVLMMALCQI
tara:strand:- start:1097 stop:1273 length:177 start_codon:yes stop_codon:yes gene_type:complete